MYNITDEPLFPEGTGKALIQSYELAGAIEKDNFGDMVRYAIDKGCNTKEEFYNSLRPEEEEILQKKWDGGDKTVKNKKGDKWFYSKVCKNSTYSSNKAVIGRALDEGLSLVDKDGKPLAKTSLERETKKSKNGGQIKKTPAELLQTYVTKIKTVYNQMTPTEQRVARSLVTNLLDNM